MPNFGFFMDSNCSAVLSPPSPSVHLKSVLDSHSQMYSNNFTSSPRNPKWKHEVVGLISSYVSEEEADNDVKEAIDAFVYHIKQTRKSVPSSPSFKVSAPSVKRKREATESLPSPSARHSPREDHHVPSSPRGRHGPGNDEDCYILPFAMPSSFKSDAWKDRKHIVTPKWRQLDNSELDKILEAETDETSSDEEISDKNYFLTHSQCLHQLKQDYEHKSWIRRRLRKKPKSPENPHPHNHNPPVSTCNPSDLPNSPDPNNTEVIDKHQSPSNRRNSVLILDDLDDEKTEWNPQSWVQPEPPDFTKSRRLNYGGNGVWARPKHYIRVLHSDDDEPSEGLQSSVVSPISSSFDGKPISPLSIEGESDSTQTSKDTHDDDEEDLESPNVDIADKHLGLRVASGQPRERPMRKIKKSKGFLFDHDQEMETKKRRRRRKRPSSVPSSVKTSSPKPVNDAKSRRVSLLKLKASLLQKQLELRQKQKQTTVTQVSDVSVGGVTPAPPHPAPSQSPPFIPSTTLYEPDSFSVPYFLSSLQLPQELDSSQTGASLSTSPIQNSFNPSCFSLSDFPLPHLFADSSLFPFLNYAGSHAVRLTSSAAVGS